jgi:hypothetical protein
MSSFISPRSDEPSEQQSRPSLIERINHTATKYQHLLALLIATAGVIVAVVALLR